MELAASGHRMGRAKSRGARDGAARRGAKSRRRGGIGARAIGGSATIRNGTESTPLLRISAVAEARSGRNAVETTAAERVREGVEKLSSGVVILYGA
ncbi:MAG: hypothetical protein ACM3JJ_09045, partial [Hyphomicrobiales bacterium]